MMMIIWYFFLLLLFSSIVSATTKEDAIPIFVLAGDAACEGYASTAQLKELYTSTQPVEVRDEKYGHLMEDEDSQTFSTSKTVYVAFDHHHDDDDWQVGPLTVGKFAYDPSSFGPELEMGHVLSNVFGDNTPIVIVKAAQAKMTLSRDFRPPSSGDWNATRAKEQSQHWKGAWQYRNLIATIQKTIRNIKEVFGKDNKQALQQFERHGHYIAGIVWFHGYSDLRDGGAEDRNATTVQSVIDEYETNLANLISDLRKDLRPEDPDEITVVVAELGGRGIVDVPSFEIDFRTMQQRVVEKDEYDYSTMYCPTARFAHVPHDDPSSTSSATSLLPLPQSDDYYYRNADTMFEIGAALAGCLLENMYQNGIIQEKNLWNDLISLQDEGATKLLLILFCCGVGVIVLVVVWRRVGRRRRQMTTTTSANMPAHEELELQEVDGTFVNQGDDDEPPASFANGSNNDDDDITNEKKGVLS